MYYINVITRNKKRLIPFFILMLFILLNLYEQYKKVGWEIISEYPKASLLFPNDLIPTHYKYIIPVLWLFPIYICVFIGTYYIDEKQKGYSEIVYTKSSIKNKQLNDYLGYFITSFLLFFIPLTLGYIFTYLFFGSFTNMPESSFAYRNSYTSMLSNYSNFIGIIQIINTAIIAGIVGITILNLSKTLKNKPQVYMTSFLLFFFLLGNSEKTTIFNLIQMFSCSSFINYFLSIIYISLYFLSINLFLVICQKIFVGYEEIL